MFDNYNIVESLGETQLKKSLGRFFIHVLDIKDVSPFVSESYDGKLTLLEEIKSIKDQVSPTDKNKSFFLEALQNNETILNIQNKKPLKENIKIYTEIYKGFYDEVVTERLNNKICLSSAQLKDGSDKIFFINLDKESKEYWEEWFEKFITLENFNGCFIFYYLTQFEKKEELEDWKRDAEYNRKSFGHSRFLRDYLKARNLAQEISIFENADLEGTKYQIENFIEQEREVINPSQEFNKLNKNLKDSLTELFTNIPFEKIFTRKKDIIHFYKFNKNRYEYSDGLSSTKFYKENIGELLNPKDTHQTLRELDELYADLFMNQNGLNNDNNNVKLIGKYVFLDNLRKALSSFFNAMIYYRRIKKAIFLFIDDKPEYLINKIEIIKLWFDEPVIYFADPSSTSFKVYCNQLKKLSDDVTLSVIEYEKKGEIGSNYSKIKFINNSEQSLYKKDNQLFIFIDLDFNGLINGFRFLYHLNNYLSHNRNKLKDVYPIIFSRYEDPYFIRKAVNTGAVYYINKSRFYRVIYKLFQLEKQENKAFEENDFSSWNSLNKIEPSLKMKLKNNKNRITGNDVEKFYHDKKIQDKLKYSVEYKWIKGLPKADLHIHIGTILQSNILPKTAMLVLYDLFRNKIIDENSLNEVIEFLIPIAFDPYIKESEAISGDFEKLKTYKITFSKSKHYNKSIFQIIDKEYNLIEKGFIPEVVLLDSSDTTLERLIKPDKLSGDYFRLKLKLRKNKKVNYDTIILVFIYLVAFRENIINEDIINELKEYISGEAQNIDPSLEIINQNSFEKKECVAIKDFRTTLDEITKSLIIEKYKLHYEDLEEIKIKSKDSNILQFLQSARSEQRCGNIGSLFNYLRGCEYGGAPHLQSKLSIYYICKYIINEYAIPENIRYLGLRCAVDGYSKFGLVTQEEAVESLLRGFNYYSSTALNEGNKVHVDIIITAKRHKSIKEFENNVRLALKYRNGLDISTCNERYANKSFFKSSSKVVSFDLAGNEKGNRVNKFYEQFYPLLKESFPITIHAGEEDDYESIWEAIFLVNSHRIGHALSLGQDEKLLDMVRDRHIAIELCPLSNFLTRKEKYEVKQSSIEDSLKVFNVATKTNRKEALENLNKINIYPLHLYFNENINVTINTDNPSVSDSTLTEEYLFAAKMSGGLSKWDILKLIKNGFKNISTDKFQKEKLMREIEDEVFQYVTKQTFI